MKVFCLVVLTLFWEGKSLYISDILLDEKYFSFQFYQLGDKPSAFIEHTLVCYLSQPGFSASLRGDASEEGTTEL